MKHTFTLAFVALFAIGAHSQKKADLEMQLASQGKQIDSLNTVLSNTAAQLDSANLQLENYKGMKQAIVDKVLNVDFEPSEMGAIIDSLQANRDANFAASTELWQDSVAVLNKQIEELNSRSILESSEAKEGMAEELKMLKGLLDEGILTPDEFNTRKAKVLEKWE